MICLWGRNIFLSIFQKFRYRYGEVIQIGNVWVEILGVNELEVQKEFNEVKEQVLELVY